MTTYATKNHGNGFIRVYIDDQRLIHFYSDDIPRQSVDTSIHDHRWDFTSHILEGSLTQGLYEEVPGDDYLVHASDSEDKLIPMGRACNLRRVGEQIFPAGSQYSLKAGSIHRVAITFGYGYAVTEVYRDHPLADSPIARIYVPRGLSADNRFDNAVHMGVRS